MNVPLNVVVIDSEQNSYANVETAFAKSPTNAYIRSFSSAEAALKKYVKSPDVVIIHFCGSSRAGISCLHLLKRVLPRTKFLVLASEQDEASLFKALDAGADGYLISPVSPEECLTAVYSVISNGIPLSPLVTHHLLRKIRPQQPRLLEESCLTSREYEIMTFVADGLLDKEVAGQLNLSVLTVKRHLHNIYNKLGVTNRVQAVKRVAANVASFPK